ncbi:galactocerebrosidase-like [Anneissia japonica]|uniref:galactocerebrosidase-like n=1 Tax=Anneissia japonica TaxID=1529436 RepID=UPI0014256957|nr:galactocerebrosidase-like [Anneissia japonica]
MLLIVKINVMFSYSRCIIFSLLLLCLTQSSLGVYHIDDSQGAGRRFDGIGGLSGGGATSRLLVNYQEPERSYILDYLFLPQFGASLHILKVEIGGDAQSTDGTESSHMHSPDDENYQRGYEWWLMKEAKKRNPSIKLYGLPWAFPGWIGNDKGSPYSNITMTANYILKWMNGAQKYHGLFIDYIGIWNERMYDKDYIKLLRKMLNENGFEKTMLVASDNKWDISTDILLDADLAKAVDIIGIHYPGTKTTEDTLKTGKTIWSSEDYSTFNDEVGGGCWARILNQNYVNGNMTSTISWNLIASYYNALPYTRNGLMTANEPWSGHYDVDTPIWISAHTTQFTQPGWYYLKYGSGAGHLDKGGSYVTIVNGTQLTMIVETMSHDHSICIRPKLPAYNVTKQEANFQLKGTFASIKSLNVWHSQFKYGGEQSEMFIQMQPIKVVNGAFTLSLNVDEVYTLTTSATGKKGQYPAPPSSSPFPAPYSDNFNDYDEFSEGNNFADQSGVFEIRQSNNADHGLVMRQVATSYPVVWCHDSPSPISFIGNSSWKDVSVSVEAFLEEDNTGVMLAARVTNGGCAVHKASGVFFWILSNSTYLLTAKLDKFLVYSQGTVDVSKDKWFTMGLVVKGRQATGSVNGKQVFSHKLYEEPKNGFLAIGTLTFAPAMFDNFNITSAA